MHNETVTAIREILADSWIQSSVIDNILEISGGIIAGSFTLKALLKAFPNPRYDISKWNTDIDIWLEESPNSEKEMNQHIYQILECGCKLPRRYASTFSKFRRRDSHEAVYDSYERMRGEIKYILSFSPLDKTMPMIQLVVTKLPPLEVIKNFDLDICSVWYDGRTVGFGKIEAYENSENSLEQLYDRITRGEIRVNCRQHLFEWLRTATRLIKYVNRGFTKISLSHLTSAFSLSLDSFRDPEFNGALSSINPVEQFAYKWNEEMENDANEDLSILPLIDIYQKESEVNFIIKIGSKKTRIQLGDTLTQSDAYEPIEYHLPTNYEKWLLQQGLDSDTKVESKVFEAYWDFIVKMVASRHFLLASRIQYYNLELLNIQQQHGKHSYYPRFYFTNKLVAFVWPNGKIIQPIMQKRYIDSEYYTLPESDIDVREEKVAFERCTDVIMMDDDVMYIDHMAEPGNIGIILGNNKMYCYSIDMFQKIFDKYVEMSEDGQRLVKWTRDTDIIYRCDLNGVLLTDTAYGLLRLEANFAVPINDIYQAMNACLEKNIRHFKLVDSGYMLERTASTGAGLHISAELRRRTQNREPSSFVSSDHCQDGSSRKVYNLVGVVVAN